MKALSFKLDSQQLNNPNANLLMAALMQNGARAMFVGGCVRDAILNIPYTDIDIAINIPPEEVIKLLDAHNIAHKPLGIEHGSILAIVNKEDFNITTLRTDVETFGRSARVAYIDDWELDANRRDFTMNALYVDRENNIYDPVNGYDDVIARKVRFIGNAEDRIQEDYLRILRYFRFYTFYGNLEPDHDTLDICGIYAHKLKGLSAERNWSEFKKILSAPNPAHTLDLMTSSGVLQVLLPVPLHDSGFWQALVSHDQEHPKSPIRRLAGIVNDNIDELKLLRLSVKETIHLKKLLKFKHEKIIDNQRFIYFNGIEVATDVALLTGNQLLLHDAQTWEDIPFPINGNDLKSLGLSQGKAVGEALQEIENWWLENNRKPDKNQCLSHFSSIK